MKRTANIPRRREAGKGESGTALVMALFIITVLTVLGTMVLNTSIVEIKMAANQKVSSQVFYAAEAGLERYVFEAVLDEISAFRLPGWAFAGLAVMLIYLFGVRIEGRLAGLAAALLFISMPRVFFHGQLACFDMAITTMWIWVVYAYFRSLERASELYQRYYLPAHPFSPDKLLGAWELCGNSETCAAGRARAHALVESGGR